MRKKSFIGISNACAFQYVCTCICVHIFMSGQKRLIFDNTRIFEYVYICIQIYMYVCVYRYICIVCVTARLINVKYVALRCSVLQYVATYCSMLLH